MPNYNPAEIILPEYDKNVYSFQGVKQDGIYIGKITMKQQIIRLINESPQSKVKAVQTVLAKIEAIEVEVFEPESVR